MRGSSCMMQLKIIILYTLQTQCQPLLSFHHRTFISCWDSRSRSDVFSLLLLVCNFSLGRGGTAVSPSVNCVPEQTWFCPPPPLHLNSHKLAFGSSGSASKFSMNSSFSSRWFVPVLFVLLGMVWDSWLDLFGLHRTRNDLGVLLRSNLTCFFTLCLCHLFMKVFSYRIYVPVISLLAFMPFLLFYICWFIYDFSMTLPVAYRNKEGEGTLCVLFLLMGVFGSVAQSSTSPPHHQMSEKVLVESWFGCGATGSPLVQRRQNSNQEEMKRCELFFHKMP